MNADNLSLNGTRFLPLDLDLSRLYELEFSGGMFPQGTQGLDLHHYFLLDVTIRSEDQR